MSYALALGTVTFLLAVIWGGPLIRLLKRWRIGKQIRVDGPSTHQVKTGTPTMGGLLMLIPVLLITAALNLPNFRGLNLIGRSILLPMGILVAFGSLGAIDDLAAVRRHQATGLLARFKFLWQFLIAGVAALGLHFVLDLRSMAVPTVTNKIDIGLWYIPVATLVIVGFSNAVNISDGLDGLAGGTSAIAFAAYGIIAYLQGQIYLLNFCFTMVGATLAFLWYNSHPANLFMGDTGSLAIGATLGTVALMTGQWLLLPLIGLVFVVETSSDIIQVLFFKLTHGRRVFKMAPLHHHFELKGWSEVQVTMRFWFVAMLAAMLGVALALW